MADRTVPPLPRQAGLFKVCLPGFSVVWPGASHVPLGPLFPHPLNRDNITDGLRFK